MRAAVLGIVVLLHLQVRPSVWLGKEKEGKEKERELLTLNTHCHCASHVCCRCGVSRVLP